MWWSKIHPSSPCQWKARLHALAHASYMPLFLLWDEISQHFTRRGKVRLHGRRSGVPTRYLLGRSSLACRMVGQNTATYAHSLLWGQIRLHALWCIKFRLHTHGWHNVSPHALWWGKACLHALWRAKVGPHALWWGNVRVHASRYNPVAAEAVLRPLERTQQEMETTGGQKRMRGCRPGRLTKKTLWGEEKTWECYGWDKEGRKQPWREEVDEAVHKPFSVDHTDNDPLSNEDPVWKEYHCNEEQTAAINHNVDAPDTAKHATAKQYVGDQGQGTPHCVMMEPDVVEVQHTVVPKSKSTTKSASFDRVTGLLYTLRIEYTRLLLKSMQLHLANFMNLEHCLTPMGKGTLTEVLF